MKRSMLLVAGTAGLTATAVELYRRTFNIHHYPANQMVAILKAIGYQKAAITYSPYDQRLASRVVVDGSDDATYVAVWSCGRKAFWYTADDTLAENILAAISTDLPLNATRHDLEYMHTNDGAHARHTRIARQRRQHFRVHAELNEIFRGSGFIAVTTKDSNNSPGATVIFIRKAQSPKEAAELRFYTDESGTTWWDSSDETVLQTIADRTSPEGGNLPLSATRETVKAG